MAGLSFGQSASSYLEGGSISPSFAEKFSSSPVSDYLNADLSFGTDVTGSDIADKLTGTGALAGGGGGWTFITAPEDVSWDVANAANRVDIFGTNNPPVVAGSRGMRDLTLGNSLVEGFVRNVSIEGKVAALEKLMEYSLNSSDGFVSVPVYQVWANNKSYGGSEAYYIIKDVKVKEAMRDLTGNATRAYVDISLMQVPAYQVNSGRDQASQVTAGGAALTPEQKAQASANAQANQKVAGAGSDGSKPASGPGVGGSTQPPKSDPVTGVAANVRQR
jgi:hypothetical protein